jgi:hypothetical protein
MNEDRVARLREQLGDMRAALIEQLAGQIEGGSLALLASVGGPIAAIDHMLCRRNNSAQDLSPEGFQRREIRCVADLQ